MKVLIVLSALACAALAKPVIDAYAPIYGYNLNPISVLAPSASQFHAQDEIGQYNYGYTNQDSSKSEFKSADGVVQGAYSYIDANGVLQSVQYISDALGFRVAATNLPVAPAVAEVKAEEPEPLPVEPATPAPVEYKAAPVEVSNQVLVPQVAYSYLPYATNYPYYTAVQPQQVAYAVQAPQYVEIPQAAIPVEAPKVVETPIQYVPSTYTIQTVAAPVESVQPAVPVTYNVEATPAVAAVEQSEPQAIVSVPILTQYHSQDELGQYNFGYSDQSSSRNEVKSADGVVSGAYNYVDTEGRLQTVNYIADALGFRVVGQTPAVVEDTPEVVAARAEHLKLVEEAQSRADEEATIDPLAEEPVDPVPATYVAEAQAVVQPVEQQVVLAQPQAYVVPQTQYYAIPQTQTYVVPQAQAYVSVPQPVVAQPNLVGQPVALSEPAAIAQAAVVAPSANQFHAQDELGQYQYGYANEHSVKNELRTADGIVRGSYSYVDANGIVQRVDYISDSLGFRVAATNLPAAPIPEEVKADQPVELEVTPAPEAAPETYVDAVPAIVEAKVEPVVNADTVVAVPQQVVVQQPVYPAYQPYASAYGYYVHPYAIGGGITTHTQHHAQDDFGQYSYGYASVDSTKSEIRTADGIVRGSYSYIDANGLLQTTNYVSDDFGFKVAATNLPVAVQPAPAA